MTDIIPSSTFDDVVKKEEKPLLIDVFGKGCAPCEWIAPVVDDLAKDLEGQARIVKLSRDEARAAGDDNPLDRFTEEHGIRGIPALLLFDKGEFKDALMGGPRSKTGIREWMEETLSLKFNVAASSPVCETYGIVVDNLPEDMNKMFDAAGDLYGQVSDVMLPFYESDEVQGIGIGPIGGNTALRGISITASAKAAQALADALPGQRVINAKGEALTPSPKDSGPYVCVDGPGM